jgi:sugar phosphate isomerase/epimerase
MKNSRRTFFKKAGTGLLALGVPSILSNRSLSGMHPSSDNKNKDLFGFGIAGYTFVKFKLEPSLEMMTKVDMHNLCIKNFHLPYDSTEVQIAEFHEKLKAKGVKGYAVGPISMKSEAEADQAFEYCKRVGVNLIVGVPEHELLPYIDKKVKDYGYHFAIHNHGYGDKLYPTLESIFVKVNNLDKRIGMCHDIGYSMLMGIDPAAATLKYGSRIFDIHLKDVTMAAAEGKDCEVGRGVIDFSSFIKALRTIKYKGMCSLEYEKDNEDPLVGIAESVGYFKGILNAV